MWSLIGLLLPPVIDLVNRKVSNPDFRFWAAVLVCVLVGSGTYYFLSNGVGVEAWASEVLAVFGLAQLSYGGVYKDSSVRKLVKGE